MHTLLISSLFFTASNVSATDNDGVLKQCIQEMIVNSTSSATVCLPVPGAALWYETAQSDVVARCVPGRVAMEATANSGREARGTMDDLGSRTECKVS